MTRLIKFNKPFGVLSQFTDKRNPTPRPTLSGFIDVPGHKRFINTMIAGISGIDLGLLVVAADDGPMPQTLEHLDVLEQLGVSELVVVISKPDRVDAQRVNAVEEELQALAGKRRWAAPETFVASGVSGEGVLALKTHLEQRATLFNARGDAGYFRMSLDRAFNIRGSGLVVTGTAASGRVAVGDTLTLPDGQTARVRTLRVHDEDAPAAAAGQRCALNLAGNLSPEHLPRGTWLLGNPGLPTSHRLDGQFTLGLRGSLRLRLRVFEAAGLVRITQGGLPPARDVLLGFAAPVGAGLLASRSAAFLLLGAAEQENAIRRAPIIDKWEVLLRKGLIRRKG